MLATWSDLKKTVSEAMSRLSLPTVKRDNRAYPSVWVYDAYRYLLVAKFLSSSMPSRPFSWSLIVDTDPIVTMAPARKTLIAPACSAMYMSPFGANRKAVGSASPFTTVVFSNSEGGAPDTGSPQSSWAASASNATRATYLFAMIVPPLACDLDVEGFGRRMSIRDCSRRIGSYLHIVDRDALAQPRSAGSAPGEPRANSRQ